MHRRLALVVLSVALCEAPRAQAQRALDERPVDAPLTDPIPRRLDSPSVARAGGQYLVAWVDWRTDSVPWLINQVLAARVTPDGRVLDPRGVLIAGAGAQRREPRVVADGDGFVVLWRETRGTFGPEVSRFARVAADGRVLDPEGVELPHFIAELGCAQGRCLGASTLAFDPRLQPFDACGTLGDEGELVVPPRTSSQSGATATAPRIASTGCGHALALGQYDERSGDSSIVLAGYALDGTQRFVRTGAPIPRGHVSPPPLDLAADAHGELLVVWQQGASTSDGGLPMEPDELWSQRFDREGAPLSEPARVAADVRPALAWGGEGYVLVSGEQGLWVRRLDAHGLPLTAEPTPIHDDESYRSNPRVAAGPDGALVVWQPASVPISAERNAARLGPAGELLDAQGLSIAASANRQSRPSLVRHGDAYVILFHDDRPDAPGVRVQRLQRDGSPAGSAVRVLDAPPPASRSVQLQSAGARLALVHEDDQGPLLSWLDPTTLAARPALRPLAADGSPLGAARLVAGDGSILALVQAPGLLCGEDQACDQTLSLVVLGEDARVADGGPAVTTYGPDREWTRIDPIAAADARGFVVAFTEAGVDRQPRDASVRVVRVGPDGGVAGSPRVASVTPESASERVVAIAPDSTGDGCLLVIARASGGSAPQAEELLALRLDRELAALDPEPFALALGSATRDRVSAIHDGEAWLVAWQERTTESTWDVRGARVPREPGSEPQPFAVADASRDELNPALAALAPDRALLAYERFDADPAVMTGRIFLRDVLPDGACAEPACCEATCSSTEPRSACELEDLAPGACAEPAPSRQVSYGCGCRVGARAAGTQHPWRAALALVLATLAAARGARRARRSARTSPAAAR